MKDSFFSVKTSIASYILLRDYLKMSLFSLSLLLINSDLKTAGLTLTQRKCVSITDTNVYYVLLAMQYSDPNLYSPIAKAQGSTIWILVNIRLPNFPIQNLVFLKRTLQIRVIVEQFREKKSHFSYVILTDPNFSTFQKSIGLPNFFDQAYCSLPSQIQLQMKNVL